MPFQKNGVRQYGRQLEWEHKRKPQYVKNRAKRNYRVPTLLEHGGTITSRTPKAVKTSQYLGNPFMEPALRKVQGKFPAMFQDLLR